MSTTSKFTFVSSCVFALSSFLLINYVQHVEKEIAKQGPIKDNLRKKKKLTEKQILNQNDHIKQNQLREYLISKKTLKDDVIHDTSSIK